MFALTALALSAHLLVPGGGKTPLLPSSDAVDVARAAVREWNYGRAVKGDIFFDIVDPASVNDPGFERVLYYVGERPRMQVRIDLWTGQVVDPDRCIYFRSWDIIAFGRDVRRTTGRRPKRLPVLASQVGCDRLTPAS